MLLQSPGISATDQTEALPSRTPTPGPLEPSDTQSFNREWLRCRQWILDALDQTQGFYNEEEVILRVLRGEAQLWPFEQSAIVTTLKPSARGQVLWLWLGGGDLAEIRDRGVPGCIDWAKRMFHVKYAMYAGRPGWIRALGFKEISRTGMMEV